MIVHANLTIYKIRMILKIENILKRLNCNYKSKNEIDIIIIRNNTMSTGIIQLKSRRRR